MSLSARCELLDTRQIPENESATAGSGLTLTCNRPLRVQTREIGEEGEVEVVEVAVVKEAAEEAVTVDAVMVADDDEGVGRRGDLGGGGMWSWGKGREGEESAFYISRRCALIL